MQVSTPTPAPTPTSTSNNTPLQADYLVIGAGATAMAFVDTLLSESADATVLMVDRLLATRHQVLPNRRLQMGLRADCADGTVLVCAAGV